MIFISARKSYEFEVLCNNTVLGHNSDRIDFGKFFAIEIDPILVIQKCGSLFKICLTCKFV